MFKFTASIRKDGLYHRTAELNLLTTLSSSNIKAENVDPWRVFIFLFLFFMAGSVSTNILFLLTFLLGHVISAWAAGNSTQCPSDPYQDPSNDPCNALGYIANNTLTAVAFSEFPISQGTHIPYYQRFGTPDRSHSDLPNHLQRCKVDVGHGHRGIQYDIVLPLVLILPDAGHSLRSRLWVSLRFACQS